MTNRKRLDKIIDNALQTVLDDYKPADGFGGWHQILNNSKIGNVATSQALLLLSKFSFKNPYEDKAYNFLLKEQKKVPEEFSLDGGWSYITNLSEVSNTESTCWAIQALLVKREIYKDQIQLGVSWLKKNVIRDTVQYGWGCIQGSGFRVYPTCKAIAILHQANESESEEFRLGLASLRKAQNDDGGWGETFKSNSTLLHTATAVITLLEIDAHNTSAIIAKAVDFIEKVLNSKSYERDLVMGYVEIFDLKYKFKGEGKDQRITFYHMALSYAIMALIKAKSTAENLIRDSIITLMDTQNLGRWGHPFLPNTYTLWAIYDVLLLFDAFKQSKYYKGFNNHQYRPSKEKFDVIIFTVVPVEFNTLNKILKFVPKDKKPYFEKRGYWYYKCELPSRNGMLSCLITMVGSAGDVDCSLACHTTFTEFDCEVAILCGIAAGYKKDLNKYDTVIANTVTAYEYQRVEQNDIAYRPHHYNVRAFVKKMNQKIELHKGEWNQIFEDNTKKIELELQPPKSFSFKRANVKSGAIASGAKLLANDKAFEILREEIPIAKGIIAAEMEGSGFAPACEEFNINWLVIRGISDYGEKDKNDVTNKKLQPLAVASAASTLIWYLKSIY